MKKTISKVAGLAVLIGLNPGTTSALNSTANDIDTNCHTISQSETINSDLLKETRAFKKQALTAEGFKSVYNQLISLSQADRSHAADLMRNDFAAFAMNNFNLTRTEEICVSRNWITEGDLRFMQEIADFVEQGIVIKTWNISLEEDPTYSNGGKRSVKEADFSFLKKKRTAKVGYSTEKGGFFEFSWTF
ncbi:MAG: hypothetical protein AB8H03_22180 [Saprospiraceae bacterium]